MFRRNMLEAYMKIRGKNLGDIAVCLGKNRCTVYKKMSQETEFTRSEIQKIKDLLELSSQETIDIFYA